MSNPRVQISGIRAVVFDLDDTLYPERAFAFSGFDAVSAWLKDRFDCPFEPAARMRHLFDHGDRRRVFDQVLADLGQANPQDLVPEMVNRYRSHPPRITLYPDADQAIRAWRNTFQLALISDGPWIMQNRKVEALGLDDRLDLVILTDEWGRDYWKPHPRAFEKVEKDFGVAGKECVYIADNPAKDFIAPRRLGWRTIRVVRSSGLYQEDALLMGGAPEAEVLSLDEVDILRDHTVA